MLGLIVVMSYGSIRDGRTARERHTLELERVNSELSSSRECLRRSQRLELFSQIAGGIAHDFNNLLTAVLIHTQLAGGAAQQRDLPKSRHHLQQIDGASRRAAALTRKLLASSRQQFVNARVQTPDAIVAGLHGTLASVLGPNVRLNVDCSAHAASINIDATQLEQVLMNLVVNANDAMRQAGGVVRLSTQCEAQPAGGAQYVLRVEDTGEGMDDHTLSNMFEPYFTTKAPGKGTGLGASIVHSIVTRAGGSIDVQSELGRGTRFDLRFSCVDPLGQRPAVPPVVLGLPSTNFRVWFCEDDLTILKPTVILLRTQGYRVQGFSDPREPLARIAADLPPHLLVTDVAMPHVNGPALAKSLRARSPRMRVLFTSGYTAGVLDQHGFDEVEAEFLPKPYGADALLDHVARLLAGCTDTGQVAVLQWMYRKGPACCAAIECVSFQLVPALRCCILDLRDGQRHFLPRI
jgi:nitrogen-specific signal transduction histidine kinase/CheY-like chemotaxis protein